MLRRIERVHELRVLIMRQIGGSGSDGGLGVVFAMLGDTRRLVDVRDGKVAGSCQRISAPKLELSSMKP